MGINGVHATPGIMYDDRQVGCYTLENYELVSSLLFFVTLLEDIMVFQCAVAVEKSKVIQDVKLNRFFFNNE